MRQFFVLLRYSVFILCSLVPLLAPGAPVEFNLPAQPAAEALLAFSKQARVEVLFSYDELSQVQATAVAGTYEPEEALNRMLNESGFSAHRNGRGKFVIARAPKPTGSITGRLFRPDGTPARNLRVAIPEIPATVTTDAKGVYYFPAVPSGTYQLTVAAPGFRTLQITGVQVEAHRHVALDAQTLQAAEEFTRLDPYVVEATSYRGGSGADFPRQAAGNLDLPRTQNDPLPYTIFDRDQLVRSGVVDLNQFLRKEVLDSDASSLPPEQSGDAASFMSGSSNLNLRSYGADETVILVNGRRLPESSVPDNQGLLGAPDVNLIPLSLVQQVEVLPTSTSALYSGNAVGGVINIVLRPETEGTEISATYTNAVGSYDAPQSSVTLQHGRQLLDGKFRFRLSGTFTQTVPPTESELGYHRANHQPPPAMDASIYRATPNVRSADPSLPLFPTGTATVTSVAPGANGTGGLAAFNGREGVRNLDLFDSPGGFAASADSLDYPYGRKQERAAFFLSTVYDVLPWLQLGLDAFYTRTVVNRGYDLLAGDLTMAAGTPLNPFPQDVIVSLNEIAPRLGENYSEAHLESASLVGSAIVKLPADWSVTFDGQYARNLTKYRGLVGADGERWQQLVDQGLYNPLRDTQVYAPPPEFYDRALVYYGGPGKFVTLGDYNTIDAAIRITNQTLALPMGTSSLNFGADYRRNELAPYTTNFRFADGSPPGDAQPYIGRTLQRTSVFGELQAPLLPTRWLPRGLRALEIDVGARYTVSDQSEETNLAPTYGLKLALTGGLSLRGSYTTSNRFPTPQMARPVNLPSGGPGGVNLQDIVDPARNGEEYQVATDVAVSPDLRPESAVTQTAGLIFERGRIHHFRASLDFADTHKTDELKYLKAQDVMNLEAYYPDRVIRAPGTPTEAGRAIKVYEGSVNVAWRHSQNWNASLDYSWAACLGGRLELYGRWVYFQKFDSQLFQDSPVIDELNAPDGAVPGLLKHRANFGANWFNRDYGFGLDGHYLYSRILPPGEQLAQGSDRIAPFWQFDAFIQSDLKRWLPWKNPRYNLRGQLRVNNIFGSDFPRYVAGPSSSGVQPYGDWRGSTFSLSVTTTF